MAVPRPGRARGRPPWTLASYLATILPGLKLRPGSIAANSPSIMCTPGAEMSCSSQGACSSADGVMVGQGAAGVDERLLDRGLDHVVLAERRRPRRARTRR